MQPASLQAVFLFFRFNLIIQNISHVFPLNQIRNDKIPTFVQMKLLFHIVFAIYFVSLTLMPCGEQDLCNETKHEQTDPNNDTHHSDDICSPLCVCACCATHFVVKAFDPLTNQITVMHTVYTIHKEAKTNSTIIPIWQPPKFA